MTKSPPTPAYIEPDVLYTKAEIQSRMGKGDVAMREAFKNGLGCHQWGHNKYLLGREVIEWVISKKGMESGNGGD